MAVVLDLYSRRAVGWSMQASMTSLLGADALMMAVWRRGRPQALLHHCDPGSQYTSEHFQKLLAEQGIICGMSRTGQAWNNSAMESYFSSLKAERTARKVYRSRAQTGSDVFDYIARFYNPTRRHSTPGYLSPIEFEKAQAELRTVAMELAAAHEPTLEPRCHHDLEPAEPAVRLTSAKEYPGTVDDPSRDLNLLLPPEV